MPKRAVFGGEACFRGEPDVRHDARGIVAGLDTDGFRLWQRESHKRGLFMAGIPPFTE